MSAFEERPPYGSYAAIMGTFAGLLAAAGALGRLLDRDPQCQTALDFTVLAAVRPRADVVARRGRDQRLPASRLLRADLQGQRAGKRLGRRQLEPLPLTL